MPIKGIHTAGASILFDRSVPADELADALAEFDILGRFEAAESWEFGGNGLTLAFPAGEAPTRPTGRLLVDTLSQCWPDGMGDPQDDPTLLGAWTMGHFGPFAYPGGLARAALQTWSWPGGRDVPLKHRGFVRLRATHAAEAGPDDPVIPPGYDPIAELRFVTAVALKLLMVPGALAYFNPNGETLRSPELVMDAVEYSDTAGVPPLDLWANVRLFNLEADWKLMDTVGHGQFDRPGWADSFPDLEACVPPGGRYDLQDVDGFFRNVCLYLISNGPAIADGDTVPGPGGVNWTAHVRRHGLVVPPRATLRFVPDDGSEPPESLLADPDIPAG